MTPAILACHPDKRLIINWDEGVQYADCPVPSIFGGSYFPTLASWGEVGSDIG